MRKFLLNHLNKIPTFWSIIVMIALLIIFAGYTVISGIVCGEDFSSILAPALTGLALLGILVKAVLNEFK